jgi:hypothetical protein
MISGKSQHQHVLSSLSSPQVNSTPQAEQGFEVIDFSLDAVRGKHMGLRAVRTSRSKK